ncbi:hypothetical protein HWV62_40134 [Athelia sp. TMB]|nr:hypothetical protein HWV62_40134 [Athelia sp. TMB]
MQIPTLQLLLALASSSLAAGASLHLQLSHKVSAAAELASNGSAPLVTNHATGVSYRGTSTSGVEEFQNVPFGKSTAGNRRFAPPVAYEPIANTTLNATIPGAACPQPFVPVPGVPLFSNVTSISEDCLNLRIARPADTKSNAKLPVMVYIYGGGDTIGQIYDQLYTPTGLILTSVANEQPIIYVAVNYRVNIFGFASTDALRNARSLNVGLRDQRLGIQWVKDNIAAFGGDPENITIFGESDGGTGVGLQLTAYGGARGVPFKRAIMQSGNSAADQGTTGNLSAVSTALVAQGANCTGHAEHTLACLRALSMETLLSVTFDVAYAELPPYGFNAFFGVVDDDFIPAAPSTLVQTGRFARDVSVIVGWNLDDSSLFTAPNITTDADVAASLTQFPALKNSTIMRLLEMYPVTEFAGDVLPNDTVTAQFYRASRIQRDLTLTCPAIDLAAHVAQYGAPARLYELNQSALAGLFALAGEAFLGVSHLSDIAYVFNEAAEYPGAAPADSALALAMSGSWAAFAATGDPASVKVPNGTTLGRWPVAFSGRAEGEAASEMVVNVIGGPSPGPVTLTAHNETGPLASEKLVSRCAYLNTLYVELQT